MIIGPLGHSDASMYKRVQEERLNLERPTA